MGALTNCACLELVEKALTAEAAARKEAILSLYFVLKGQFLKSNTEI